MFVGVVGAAGTLGQFTEQRVRALGRGVLQRPARDQSAQQRLGLGRLLEGVELGQPQDQRVAGELMIGRQNDEAVEQGARQPRTRGLELVERGPEGGVAQLVAAGRRRAIEQVAQIGLFGRQRQWLVGPRGVRRGQ